MFSNGSIDTVLTESQLAITAALTNPQLQTYLSPYGYTLDKLQQGQALYQAVFTAHQKQKTETAQQIGSTARLTQLRDSLQQTYMRHLKLARIVFKSDPIAINRLDLNGDRKQSFSGWLQQTQQFYTGMIEDPKLVAGMATVGISLEALTEAQSLLQAVFAAKVEQETEKGEAQQATQQRDAALDDWMDWFRDFRAIAKIALEPDPQLLESLGVVVE